MVPYIYMGLASRVQHCAEFKERIRISKQEKTTVECVQVF